MLTELKAKNAQPKEKYYMLHDDRGLYLRVDPSGRKYWILRYQDNGRAHQRSLGAYPTVSLREARDKRDKARRPSDPQTFAEAAEEWLDVRMNNKAEGYLKSINLRLRKYILPALGKRRIGDITSKDILLLCRKIEDDGLFETAQRVKGVIGQVFRFAIAAGWAETDPTYALVGALSPQKVIHYPTFTEPDEIAALMRAIRAYPYDVMRCALLFSVYTAVRPGEVRRAEWSEINADTWVIPAEKMKMKRRHIVPLSHQALEVLKELQPLTGGGRYLFPSPRNDGRCMSENGTRIALRIIGFTKEQIVPHGFRAMFSTIAYENGWRSDVIERQLAHSERNSVKAAYNHAEYLKERRELMQWWADWLCDYTTSRPFSS